ncbi:MAG TPA: hypothetical protein VMW35_15265 [Myxococcota bacterium]|nr:hypothetical protein [Myxococcota bacterium]
MSVPPAPRHTLRSVVLLACLALAWAAVTACGRDEADREYFAALAGEKRGASPAELLPHVDRAIFLAPERASYWEKRGGYRTAMGDLVGAEADLDRAIVLADRPYLRFERGLVRCKAGRCAEALADFDVAIAAQPENAQFYRGRALARVAAGRAEAGLEDAERLIALASANGESFYPRGVALAALGRLDGALADFDETLRRRPDLVYPLLARAACLERLGDTARAAADRAEAKAQGAGTVRPGEGCGVCFDPLHF